MEYREFLSLTEEEIRQIVFDIFQPKEIKDIAVNATTEEISCTILTEWESNNELISIEDEVILVDPWKSDTCVHVDFSLENDAFYKFRQFCFAKGICPYFKDNPYLVV